MSHSTNIPVSPELRELFTAALRGEGAGSRYIGVCIESESLCPKFSAEVGSDVASDFATIRPHLEAAPQDPVFIVFNHAPGTRSQWSLVAFVPADSRVQVRMLYGATRATLKRSLGPEHFGLGEYFCDTLAEWSLEAFEAAASSAAASSAAAGGSASSGAGADASANDAATSAEIERARADKLEAAERSRAAGTQGVGTGVVPFALTAAASAAVDDLNKGSVASVRLFLDPTSEQIDLDGTATDSTPDNLGASISGDRPLFILHCVGSERHLLLVYYCPDAAAVRLRMMASTCKGTLIKTLKADKGLEVVRSLECQEGSEITGDYVRTEITSATKEVTAASVPVVKTRISRPTRPGKGGARLTSQRK